MLMPRGMSLGILLKARLSVVFRGSPSVHPKPSSLTRPHHHSVSKSCPTLCDSMDCNMSGFPIPRYLLELAQVHVHRIGNAIQPSHPLSLSSPPALNLSQHRDLFQ